MTGMTGVCVCGLWRCVCLQRYLVAVGGIALQQQWSEQLDQSLIAEDTALLEQESMLEPAIPQLSSIGGEAYPAREGGNKRDRRQRKAVCFFDRLLNSLLPIKRSLFYFVPIICFDLSETVKLMLKKTPNLTAYRLVKKEVGGGVKKPIGISKRHNSTCISMDKT